MVKVRLRVGIRIGLGLRLGLALGPLSTVVFTPILITRKLSTREWPCWSLGSHPYRSVMDGGYFS